MSTSLINAERLKLLCKGSLSAFIQRAFGDVGNGQYHHCWHIEAMSEYLTACYRRDIKRLIINVPPRSLKPLSIDTLVTTESGRKRLVDISIGDKVLTHTGKFKTVLGLSERKNLPCVEIKSQSGRSIISALDHPFLLPDGWRNAGDIDVGELLALKSPLVGERYGLPVNRSEARLLGYIVGDGAVAYQSCTITAIDEEEIEDIKACVSEMPFFCVIKQYSKVGHALTIALISVDRNAAIIGRPDRRVQEWLKSHNLAQKNSYTKRVPLCIMNGDREAIINFLSAYWVADGTICPKGKTRTGEVRKDLHIGCDSVSEELLLDIQHLLLKLGIDSLVRKKTVKLKTKKQGDYYTSYHLNLRSQDSVWHFTKIMPIFHKKKNSIINHHVRRINFDQEYFSDAVVSKEGVGIKECMCIEVEDDHTFCANDFVVKNSISTTIAFPAWALGHNPKLEIMTASYSQDLSEDHSVACRKIMQSEWYRNIFPNTILAPDQNQKSKFNTTLGGARRATSVGGTSIGKGFNIGILDDPLSPLQASSETERKSAINFLQQSWMTRLNDKKEDVSIVVMQRLHEEDPAGFLLAQGGWEHLFLPAINDKKRTITIGNFKKEWDAGEYLDPERMGEQTLDQIKVELGSFSFCTPKESPILMADLTMKPIGAIVVGDNIIGFNTDTESSSDLNYKNRVLTDSIVVAITESCQEVVEMELSSGRLVRCTANHEWYTRRYEVGMNRKLYAPAKIGSKLMRICYPEIPKLINEDDFHLAGWLAGFFDGEGSAVIQHTQSGSVRCLISFAQGAGRNLPLCEKLEKALTHFGFSFGYHERVRDDRVYKRDDCHLSRWYYLTKMTLPMYQKFLHVIKPTKWRDRMRQAPLNAKFIIEKEKVVNIRPIGKETVYGLTTTTGNYVVWGLASKNCGQYMQRPSPQGGGIIKEEWWQLWEGKEPPKTHDIIQVYDTAFTEKTTNDYCARTTWGIFEAENGDMNIILLERLNKRLEFPELLAEAKEAYIKYTKRRTGEPPLVLIEEKASGLPLIQELRRIGVRVRGIKRNANSGDKLSRCHNITHIFENGRVWIPCNMHEVDGKKHYVPKPFAQEVVDQCMIAGTAIITKYGVKNIEDINVGDLVLTHKGRFRPVLATFKNTSKDFIKISPKSLDEMVITPNHPLYALSLSSTRKPIELGWVHAGDIQARKYRDALRAGKSILQAYPSACHAATLPIIQRECPIDELDLREWATLPNGKRYDFIHDDEIMTTSHSASQLMKWKQPLDYKFGRVIGLYIAEGSFTRHQTKWSFNALTEQHFVNEIKDFIENRLGCGTTQYTAAGATSISANLPLLETFFLECGKRAENKRIPEWVWDAPDDFILGLIDGYVDGDGCDNFWNVVSCTTVSQSLAWGMRLLGARIGIHATVNVIREVRQGLIQGRLCNLQKTYSIRWVKDRQNMGASFLHEDQLAYSVMHSEKITFNEEINVYNMRVADDESYCTTGGMVHNCSLFPNGAHDDLVDTVVDAVAYLRKWREIKTDYDREEEPEIPTETGKKRRYY